MTPKTSGTSEHFNGRISDVLNTIGFSPEIVLLRTLLRYSALYNHCLPQSELKGKPPLHSLKNPFHSAPNQFLKRQHYRPRYAC